MKSIVAALRNQMDTDAAEPGARLVANFIEIGNLVFGLAAEMAGYSKRTFMGL